MSITLPPLPYAYEDLEPHISSRTLQFHYDKHHRTYVDKTNELAAKAQAGNMKLEELIRNFAGNKQHQELFNNAAQVWNHNFYWQSLSPDGGGAPEDEIASRLSADFGSQKAFNEKFAEEAMKVFGTGWVWLVADAGKFKIVTTLDADTPLAHGQTALFTVDVWEHSYYLDYQHERNKHVEAVIENLINWDFAYENLRGVNQPAE